MSETKEEQIKRGEEQGWLVKDCPGCEEHYAAANPCSVFAPRHKASDCCESGKRAHCTCDVCF